MLFFPLQSDPRGSETAWCSPRAPGAELSEELDMAGSDLGTKLHFRPPRSSLLATKLMKLVLPTLQLCSFVTFAPGLVELQTQEQINLFHGGKKVPVAPPANQPCNSSR